jgi:3-hydroxyacyl-CoA dehydrogenase
MQQFHRSRENAEETEKNMNNLNRVAIIGAGIMGPGIAAVFASAGARVSIYDISDAALDQAKQGVDAARSVLNQLRSSEAGEPGDIVFTTSLEDALAQTQFVLEAVPEKAELKATVLRQIEDLVDDSVIISSNTSGIPITDLAQNLRVPERFVGMHWSNPPHVIPLIEVVPGEKTADEVADSVSQIAASFGYESVREKETPGFVENRILYAIMRESLALVNEGIISQADLDVCVRWGIGFKLAVVGPMRLLDMAGLDTYHSVASYLNPSLSAAQDVPQQIADAVERGDLGFKSGQGLFDYADGEVAQTRQKIVKQLISVRQAMPQPRSDDQV